MPDDAYLIDVLLNIHDGDDRCGCLREIIRDLLADPHADVLPALRECIERHPAGLTYRRGDR